METKESSKSVVMNEVLDNSELQFIFVGGKGGVGKTTSSCGLSIQRALAQSKKGTSGKTLLISTDPAHNVSDAFQQEFGSTPIAVKNCSVLDEAGIVLECMEVDPEAVMQKEFGEVTDGLQDEMVKDFRQWITSVPGIDEAMALAEVLALVDSGEYSTLVFDTAPTGHTLRLLQLPQVLNVGISKLKSWQARLGGVMGALAGAFNKDSDKAAQAKALKKLKDKLKYYQTQVQRIADIFKDQKKTTFVCVCIAENLSVFETVRLVKELRDNEIATSHLLVNQLVPRSFVSMAATDETGKSRLPLNSLVGALQQLGLESSIVTAAKEACELCGARASIQAKYLDQLAGSLGESHIICRLPLLPKEVCGANNIAAFSTHMVVANEKLMDNAATSVQSVVTDKDMLNRLNNLLAAADKKTNPVQEKTNPVNVTPSPVTPSVDPMMLLMQLQGVLALPDGLAKVLGHENVVAARKSTPVVEEFCSAVEAAGPMAALGFLGRPEAMDALTSILPGVLADIKTSSTPPDDEVEDIYD
jgi:arsenite-transporting ATPase